MSDSIYSFRAGPTYRPALSGEMFEAALDMPMSRTSTFFDQAKGGVLESFGAGTVIREAMLPEEAPAESGIVVDPGDGTEPITVPDTPDMRRRMTAFGELSNARPETQDEFQARRVEAKSLDEGAYKSSSYFREGVPWDAGMTEDRAASLAASFDAKKVREFYASKRPITAFLGNLAGQAVDPINYVPVAGPTVRAAAVARLGKVAGASVTASLDAAANTAIFGIATARQRAKFGDDVSWQTTVSQIATAALIGAGFGAIGGALGGRGAAASRTAIEERLATLKTTQEARIALNEGIDALVRGEDVALSPNATGPLRRVAGDIQRADRQAVGAEPPVPDGFVRVYHSGDVGEGETGRWVSTSKPYASNYRSDLPLFYLDLPENDPRINHPDYPDEQGVKRGFTFNFETTPEEAARLREVSRSQSPEGLSLRRGDHGEMALPEPKPGIDDRVYAIEKNGEPVAFANIRVTGDTADVRDIYSVTDTRHGLLGLSAVRKALRDFLRENPEVKTLTGERVTGARFGGSDHGFAGEGVPFRMDVSTARADAPPEGIAEAERSIAKPDDYKALSAQYRVDPDTGTFSEEADIAQLGVEGRLTDDDAAILADAQAAFEDGAAYGEALKSVASCLI